MSRGGILAYGIGAVFVGCAIGSIYDNAYGYLVFGAALIVGAAIDSVLCLFRQRRR